MYGFVVFAFLLSVVVCAGIGGWLVVRHDSRRPAFALGLFMLLMALWSATHVGTLSSTTEPWLLRFTQLSYLGVVLAPVVWLVFSLRYRDRGDVLTTRRLAALLVVPAVTIGVVFTAEHHSLQYTSMAVETVAGQQLLATTSGVWHSVNVVYSYSLLLVGTGLLAQSALRDNRLYRHQSAVLLACVVLPWVVNAAYHVGLRPIPWVDPTPLAFTIVGVPLAAIVVRTDLTSFLPVAHERLFRTLEDPIVVATPADRVVDSNGAARSVLGQGDALEGVAIADVLPDGLLDGDAPRPDLDGSVECSLDVDGETRRYIARRRDVAPGFESHSRGYLVSLTDITVQKDQQMALERKTERLEEQTGRLEEQTARLERKNEQLERLADIVSHDLGAPLSTAETLIDFLEADLDDPPADVRRSVDDLGSVHERLRSFADHLPQLARESTGVETTAAVDLSEVAREAWTVVETGAVTLEIEESRPLQADRRRLQQVFENLFRNAIDHGTATTARDRRGRTGFRGDGGVDGSSRTAREAGGREAGRREAEGSGLDRDGARADSVTTVRVGTTETGFFVADDGPGVPPEMRAEVFAYGTSTGDGSGFGLAIVRTIVEAHDWEIALTDGADGGARFDIGTGR